MGKEVNIVVIGAGISGICAALSIAEEGHSVTIIERSNSIGGNATRSNVGTICGSYLRSENNQDPVLVGNDFSQSLVTEIMEEMDLKSPIKYHKGLYIIPYEWEVLQGFFTQKITKNPLIRVLLNASLNGLEMEGGVITKATTSHKIEKEIYCQGVVDCSGIGVVSDLLNLPLITSTHYQSASQVFRVSNVNSTDEFSMNMSIKKMIWETNDKHSWPKSYRTLSIVPGSFDNGRMDLKLTLPDSITDSTDFGELNKNARIAVKTVFDVMSQSIAGFTNANIDLIFPEVGIRVLKRAEGKAILTEEQVLSTGKTSNGVAVGVWPIEYWNKDGGLDLITFDENDYYLISASCLESKEVKNLFFAGKNISASDKAIASARVIGTCIQTGYAAGKMVSNIGDDQLIPDLRKALKVGDEYI